MSNRVRELESAVAQLQATVDGLREELVDANERIRELEQEAEQKTDQSKAEENGDVSFSVLDGDDPVAADDEDEETDEESAAVEDIIVA